MRKAKISNLTVSKSAYRSLMVVWYRLKRLSDVKYSVMIQWSFTVSLNRSAGFWEFFNGQDCRCFLPCLHIIWYKKHDERYFLSMLFPLVAGMFNNANVLFKTKFVDGVSTVTRYTQNQAMRGSSTSDDPRQKKKQQQLQQRNVHAWNTRSLYHPNR